MATKSAAYNKGELEALWIHAGGPKAEAQTAAAIALAESDGITTAVNPEGPEHAEGLWQIKGQLIPGNPLNPEVSAANAVAKWRNAKGFSPWQTFTEGTYKKYLGTSGSTLASKGEAALNGILGGLLGGGAKLGAEGVEKAAEPAVEAAGGFKKTEEDLIKSVGAAGAFFETLTNPQTWLRGGEMVAGFVLFFIGLKTLTRGSATNTVVQQGGSVAGGVKSAIVKTAEVAAVAVPK